MASFLFVAFNSLAEACEHGHPETAQLLLRGGANINKKGTLGAAPMQIAAEKGHLELSLGEGDDRDGGEREKNPTKFEVICIYIYTYIYIYVV